MNKKVFEFFRNKEYGYRADGKCIVFIDLDDIEEFVKLMTRKSNNFFSEVCQVILQPTYICVEAEPICEWFGIEVNELFPKEEG